MTFDPFHLRPEASLNQTRLASFPNAEPLWIRRPAFDLLSLAALTRLANELGLPSDGPDVPITWPLAAALASSDPARAVEITNTLGRRLGHLIATLTSPPSPPAEDVSPWRRAYLDHWSRIEHVWLGGGIAAACGPGLAHVARAELHRLGARPCQIEVAPHASTLALLGAARSLPPSDGRSLVFDFGQTAVKRGIATVENGQLRRLDLLPNRVSAQARHAPSMAHFVLETVLATFNEQPGNFGRQVEASIASYVPLEPGATVPGSYGSLFTPESQVLLRQNRAGIELDFLHDSSTAARAVPYRPQAACISLGTALGVGFTPSPVSLLPFHPDLAVAPPAL